MSWLPKPPDFSVPLNLADLVRGEPVVRFDVQLGEKNSLIVVPLWKSPKAPEDWQMAVFDHRVLDGKPFTEYFNQRVTFEEMIIVRPVKRRVILRIRRAGYIPFQLDIRLKKGKHWTGTLYWDLAYSGDRKSQWSPKREADDGT